MFLCALFMCFIFEIQCIKQVAKLVVLPPIVMGYDDIDDHKFIISDEENTPDEIKRPVIANAFDKEIKNSPVTKTRTSNILLTTLLPNKNHEKYKTSITDKDTKMSPPDSSADSDSNDDSTLPATKKKEELDKSQSSHEQDKTSQKELHVNSEETQKSDGIKSDDVIAKSELLSSTTKYITKEKEVIDKSSPSHEQDVTSQKELHVDSEETQKSDGIKSDDVIAKSELTTNITKEKEVIDKSSPSHEQDVTSQKELHVDSEETQKSDGIKSDDVIAKSELLSSTTNVTKEKEVIDKSSPSHEQDVTSQKELYVDSEETQKSDGIKSDDVIANSELSSLTLPITKDKEMIDKSPPSHEQEQVHVDKEGTLGDTKKEDKVQKEDSYDEDHQKTSESTEYEKPVPVARNYLVNGFI